MYNDTIETNLVIHSTSFWNLCCVNAIVSVVLVTAIFWIPASTTISYVDRKKRRNDAKEYKWNNSLDLIHPSDRRRVIHIR